MAAVDERIQRLQTHHAAEMRRMELRLAQSEHYGRTVADARDAARNRVTTLEAEVAHYSGQAEEASEQLATTQEELAAAQLRCARLEAEDAAIIRAKYDQALEDLGIMQDRAFRAEDRAAYLASQLLMHRQGAEAAQAAHDDDRAALHDAEAELVGERAASAARAAQVQQAQAVLAAVPAMARAQALWNARARAAHAHQGRVNKVLAILMQRQLAAAAAPAVPALPAPPAPLAAPTPAASVNDPAATALPAATAPDASADHYEAALARLRKGKAPLLAGYDGAGPSSSGSLIRAVHVTPPPPLRASRTLSEASTVVYSPADDFSAGASFSAPLAHLPPPPSPQRAVRDWLDSTPQDPPAAERSRDPPPRRRGWLRRPGLARRLLLAVPAVVCAAVVAGRRRA